MDIPYISRSKFLENCEAALTRLRPAHSGERGEEISVAMPEGGYSGKVQVTVKDNGSSHVETDWTGKDATRFPVRIRAAATALKTCRQFGRFEIEHKDQELVIRVRALF